jgi:hypothetical protein
MLLLLLLLLNKLLLLVALQGLWNLRKRLQRLTRIQVRLLLLLLLWTVF